MSQVFSKRLVQGLAAARADDIRARSFLYERTNASNGSISPRSAARNAAR